jgi:hypothetical protein
MYNCHSPGNCLILYLYIWNLLNKILIKLKNKIKGKGVIFFICKLPPEDIQIWSSLSQAFPMIHVPTWLINVGQSVH